MTKIIRSAYGPKIQKTTVPDPERSRTKQSFKDECDINKIMAKYQTTGVITHVAKHAPQYGFAPSLDFQTAMNLINKANDQFADLPSQVRRRFDNNPAEFLQFCENPDNRSEMALLGLLEPEVPNPDSPTSQPSDSATAPLAPNPADIEPNHESA